MNTLERKQTILQRLEEKGSVNINELAEELEVSSMTIRRDLAKFEKEGIVTIEYGGAVLNNGALFEYNMSVKKDQFFDQKTRIAKEALKHVKNGDSIFLDAGTTNLELAKRLGSYSKLTVLTHSLIVANELCNYQNIELIMCPGVFRKTSMAFMGQMTDSFIKQFKIDTLFLGVESVSADDGVGVPNVVDGATKRQLVKYSESVICLADSSKVGKSTFYKICDLDDIDVIITDDEVSVEEVEKIKDHNVEIVVV